MTVIFISPKFDRELQEKNLKLEANNG